MTTNFVSLSGLRPFSAFVVIGAVVLSVGGAVVEKCVSVDAAPTDRVKQERVRTPEFTIEDREGTTLACSFPRFHVGGSARGLWHAHTPERIVAALGAVLPDLTVEELFERLLPGSQDGWLLASRSEFDLGPVQAMALEAWLKGLREEAPRLDGFRLLEQVQPDGAVRYRVAWRPREVLSERTRSKFGDASAWTWARNLTDGLIGVVDGPALPRRGNASRWNERRKEVWRALFPSDELRIVEDLDPALVAPVEDALRSEQVASWQLGVQHDRVRGYPSGELEVVGHRAFTNEQQTEPIPVCGLERLVSRLLAQDVWSFLDHEGSRYEYRLDRAVRGSRANAYLGYHEGQGEIVVHSTIDVGLQRFLEERLDRLQEEHRPALSMAVVVDVDSGEVLAVDSATKYETGFHPPVFHEFTPGSTFKILTMALALERGVVHPDDELDVGLGSWVVSDPEQPSRRRSIHEADHSPTGVHPVRFFFAKSVNAAFVQIGQLLDDQDFRGFLARLGYGARPGAGLGAERTGLLAPLPWDPIFTHASISFGHEITTTLWQHATGLTSVLRGGEWKPLTLVRGVSQGGRFYAAPARRVERVLSESTCATVRELMTEGVAYGTGRDLGIEGVVMGSKTGTTEKVEGEVCAHVALAPGFRMPELPKVREARVRTLEAWMRPQAPHDTCYTSSICLWGRVEGTDRTICVLAVVDEVEDIEAHYGSKVAGPVARDVLVEALGLTRGGRTVDNSWSDEFRAADVATTVGRNEFEEPWRGDAR